MAEPHSKEPQKENDIITKEVDRLNKQHDWFQCLYKGALLHCSIATTELTTFADVACGTGQWLLDLSQQLSSIPTETGLHRHFRGFDYNSGYFPSAETLSQHCNEEDIEFIKQDVVQRFPQTHMRHYDVVHVRSVMGYLHRNDFQRAVVNIIDLLKPGGYLQWDELEFGDATTRPFVQDTAYIIATCTEYLYSVQDRTKVVSSLSNIMDDTNRDQLYRLPGMIADAVRGQGLDDVQIITKNTSECPDLKNLTAETFHRALFRILVGAFTARVGVPPGEVIDPLEKATRVVRALDQACKEQDAEWHIPYKTVLARRPAWLI